MTSDRPISAALRDWRILRDGFNDQNTPPIEIISTTTNAAAMAFWLQVKEINGGPPANLPMDTTVKEFGPRGLISGRLSVQVYVSKSETLTIS